MAPPTGLTQLSTAHSQPQSHSHSQPQAIKKVDDQIKSTIHTLYSLLLQTHAHTTPPRSAALTVELRRLPSTLTSLSNPHHSSSSASGGTIPDVPPELLEYVEAGRNPDIYTREFAELVQARNQALKGRAAAFGRFAEVLREEWGGAVPEVSGLLEGKAQEGAVRNEDGM